MHELLAGLVEDPEQVVIGIETDRGLWVGALHAGGYQVYAINPLAVARYRDRHAVGGGDLVIRQRVGYSCSAPTRSSRSTRGTGGR